MTEHAFIRRLREQTRKHSTRLVTGIGDDASVINQTVNHDLIVTTDLLIEGVDFFRDAAPARILGHRALAVSLSDIAAMGGRPLWSLLSMGMPAETWRDNFKDEFFAGYLELGDRYGVSLAGGDLSEAKAWIVIDSIVLGEVAAGAAVLRSGAQPGDQVYVTGTLGGAAAGLKLIEMGARLGEDGLSSLPRAANLGSSPTISEGSNAAGVDTAELKAIETLLLRQLRPSPRVGWGIVLGDERLASAMIDISDGLSSDLGHLCEASQAGALIDSATLPIDKDVTRLCGRRALDPRMLALHGGEDFELLFTVHPDQVARVPKKVDGVEVSCIGRITSETGKIRVSEKDRVWDLEPGGFDHFKKS